MQAKRIALRRLDSHCYYCEELGILIDLETVEDERLTRWAMAAGQAIVYAEGLGECRRFLEAIFDRAQDRVVSGRSKKQARLDRLGRGRWRTADGIEVWVERRRLAGGSAMIASFHVDLSPADPRVPAVRVGANLNAARRLIAAVPWRGAPSNDGSEH